ncbi:RUN domain-containing protein 1-like [Oscarella lobularis]|uniref:RUN domain-containing protein 1-like n=1 Tax=Oscarella lobularis TaxID=121494 RepID=UPI003313A8AA
MATLSELSEPEAPQGDELERLQQLEAEQAELNSSLLALTTHFAQVQFRLKQIISADSDQKEELLRELEQFAFQGCRDPAGSPMKTPGASKHTDVEKCKERLERQSAKQQELMAQLQLQLEDLEKYSESESGADSGELSLKQKYVIDQLKHRLDLKFDDIESMDAEELKQTVDDAVGKVTQPAKSKERIIDQLRMQVSDLERYIAFLQASEQNPNQRPPPDSPSRDSPRHSTPLPSSADAIDEEEKTKEPKEKRGSGLYVPSAARAQNQKSTLSLLLKEKRRMQTARSGVLTIMRKSLSVMQMFAANQLGVSGESLVAMPKKQKRAPLDKDALTNLKRAVDAVIEAHATQIPEFEPMPLSELYTETEGKVELGKPIGTKLDRVVRRQLGGALSTLFRHGMNEPTDDSWFDYSLGCFCKSSMQIAAAPRADPWRLFIQYYDMKARTNKGEKYNKTNARKLSDSFGLDIEGGIPVTAKQSLLSAIHIIRETHDPLKRSGDTQFRSLICGGLNEGKLGKWCEIIANCKPLIEKNYYPWSYICTGFGEAIHQLDRLKEIPFSLLLNKPILKLTEFNHVFSDPV